MANFDGHTDGDGIIYVGGQEFIRMPHTESLAEQFKTFNETVKSEGGEVSLVRFHARHGGFWLREQLSITAAR